LCANWTSPASVTFERRNRPVSGAPVGALLPVPAAAMVADVNLGLSSWAVTPAAISANADTPATPAIIVRLRNMQLNSLNRPGHFDESLETSAIALRKVEIGAVPLIFFKRRMSPSGAWRPTKKRGVDETPSRRAVFTSASMSAAVSPVLKQETNVGRFRPTASACRTKLVSSSSAWCLNSQWYISQKRFCFPAHTAASPAFRAYGCMVSG